MGKKQMTKALQKFTPTAGMKRWIEAAFELGYGANITDVSKKAKVVRQMWYEWIANEKFVRWWDSMWQKHLVGMRWRLDAIGLKKAEDEYDYWKDMMIRTGNMPQQQGGAAVQINTIVGIKREEYGF